MDRTLGHRFNSCEVMGWSCFFQVHLLGLDMSTGEY